MDIILTKSLIAKEAPLSFTQVYKKISAYIAITPNFTISGALRAANMSMKELVRIQEEPQTKGEQNIAKLFENLKLIIAEFLEGEIIYQKRQFFNHNQATWMLKKLYPDMYGDKVVSKEITYNANAKQTQYTFATDLKNESGFSLIEKQKTS